MIRTQIKANGDLLDILRGLTLAGAAQPAGNYRDGWLDCLRAVAHSLGVADPAAVATEPARGPVVLDLAPAAPSPNQDPRRIVKVYEGARGEIIAETADGRTEHIPYGSARWHRVKHAAKVFGTWDDDPTGYRYVRCP